MPRKMKKRAREEESALAAPAKKTKLLEEDSEGEDTFKINEDFAKRFEHNNKRKELQQLEEKYGKNNVRFQNGAAASEDENSESSSSDEDEDDDGEFATADLDAEINDTLKAIRSKDPRVYDSSAKFYKEFEAPSAAEGRAGPKEKAMTLKDYHRKNFLAAAANGHEEDEEDEEPKTYMQEQAALKSDLVKALHDAADDGEQSDSENEYDDDDNSSFLRAKARPTIPSSSEAKTALPDPSTADRDPENYLSNFFAARAWVPTSTSRFAHLESDDESADERAEQFETAYNLRFEDPSTSNTTLKTHARDVVAAVSVRRDEAMNPRKRARERAKAEKEREREEREVEKNRLRKLKVEEMEGKLERIRYAAGSGDVDVTEWAAVLQEDWDDARFDEEMRKRFGDAYYEGKDEGMAGSGDEDEEEGGKKGEKGQVKKPTWDDDIDIKDLVSDFEDEEEAPVLSDDDDDGDIQEAAEDGDAAASSAPSKPQKKSKTASKRDRRLLESLAAQSSNLDIATLPSNSKSKSSKGQGPRFAYHETSPTTFGLSTLDILAADDAQLNEWAGLKKLATFREEGKKEKDRRRLGKKGRLREWRKDTFGSKEGPGLKDWFLEGAEVSKEEVVEDGGVDIREGGGKKKRKKRSKKKGGEAVV